MLDQLPDSVILFILGFFDVHQLTHEALTAKPKRGDNSKIRRQRPKMQWITEKEIPYCFCSRWNVLWNYTVWINHILTEQRPFTLFDIPVQFFTLPLAQSINNKAILKALIHARLRGSDSPVVDSMNDATNAFCSSTKLHQSNNSVTIPLLQPTIRAEPQTPIESTSSAVDVELEDDSQTDRGIGLVMHRYLLRGVEEADSLKFLYPLRTRYSVILLCHGGNFSGGVFLNGQPIAHKTFSRYIIRKKQGKRQSNNDKSNRTSSAGSSLRRYNEDRFEEDVRDVILKWDEYLANAAIVLLHAPGHNAKLFFESSATLAALKAYDPHENQRQQRAEAREEDFLKAFYMSKTELEFERERRERELEELRQDGGARYKIFKIPFATGTPLYNEVKRVFAKMFRVKITTVNVSDINSNSEDLEDDEFQDDDSDHSNDDDGLVDGDSDDDAVSSEDFSD